MKKFVVVVVGLLCILTIIWQVYDAAIYYSKNTIDLLYVFAIAFVGGIAFWIFSKCSPNLQRRTQLILLGLMAIASSLTCIALIFVVIQFGRDLLSGKAVLYLVAIGLSILACTYIFWEKFYRILKRRQ